MVHDLRVTTEEPNLQQAKVNKVIKVVLDVIKAQIPKMTSVYQYRMQLHSFDLINQVCSFVWCQGVNKQTILELTQLLTEQQRIQLLPQIIYDSNRFFVYMNSTLKDRYEVTSYDSTPMPKLLGEFAKFQGPLMINQS
jgi:hypothetical protein